MPLPVHFARSLWDTQHDPMTWKLIYLLLVLTVAAVFFGMVLAMVLSAIRARKKFQEHQSRQATARPDKPSS